MFGKVSIKAATRNAARHHSTPGVGHRAAALAGSALLALSLAGCASFKMPYIPYIHPAPPDLTPAHQSAENLVRLDAELRTGCDNVEYIDKPAADAHSQAPQRWVAHTCRGELSYDVETEHTDQGPVVKVTPVAAPIDKPMNPNTIPATPDQPPASAPSK